MKNRLPIIVILCLAYACSEKNASAKTDSQRIDQDVQNYMSILSNIDPCLGKEESFEDMAQRMNQARAPLDNVNDIAYLKAIYYTCNKKLQEEPPRKERCGSAYFAAQERVIQRVGEIGNIEAAAFLMELYMDQDLKFFGTSLSVMGQAMVKCGENILPDLEPVKDLRIGLGPRVVECIQNKTPF